MNRLKVDLNNPIFLRNLIIFPLKNGSDGINFNLETIDDTISKNKVVFSELSVPDVNKIICDNRGDSLVLMIDGEEITGSLQNRIIARSVIAKPHSRSPIPVICAEEKRWEEIGGFKIGYCSYPRVRSILAASFGKKIDIQHAVWKEIERKLTVTKTKSRTSSMHEIFDNLSDEIERYLEGFTGLDHNTLGFIGVAGNRILGCDIFSSAKLYHKFEKKLLRSYALDAIEYQRIAETKPDIESFFKMITSVFNREEIKTKSGHKRIKDKKFSAQVVFHQNQPVHLSAFPD